MPKNKEPQSTLLIEKISNPFIPVSVQQIMELLVHGENVNQQDKSGMTPLMWATFRNRVEIVKLLIRRGADVNAQDKEFQYTALHFGVQERAEEALEILLRNGAKTNLTDKFGNVPLARMNLATPHSIIKLLLSYGCDLIARTIIIYHWQIA